MQLLFAQDYQSRQASEKVQHTSSLQWSAPFPVNSGFEHSFNKIVIYTFFLRKEYGILNI